MIVPRSRLLFWVAVIVLPFTLLAPLGPLAFLCSALGIGALVGLALVDAALGFGRVQGLKFELPEVVRLSKDRQGKIDLRIQNPGQKAVQVRVGLALPESMETDREGRWVALPGSTEWSRLEWPCRPMERGHFELERIYLEHSSPLGFWGMRRAAPLKTELRVYPNLSTERKNLAALFLNRGSYGAHAQRQIGKGRDFEKLRDYIPGDGFDEIHWKATAKRGHPVTKVFQIERTQEIYVIIDASRLSARKLVAADSVSRQPGQSELTTLETEPEGTHAESNLERYLTAALLLGLAAEQQGDLFGLLVFADSVRNFLRAKSGTAHYHACRDALYNAQPGLVTPDYHELASFIRLRLRRRALLVFLTALDDPLLAESFVQSMDLICRQHLVLVNMLQPPGAKPMFAEPEVHTMDDLYTCLGGHLQWHKLQELQRVLQRRGVQFSLLENEKLSAGLIAQYLNVKRRQLI